jgi:periplasmic divalent cation tolerance protein
MTDLVIVLSTAADNARAEELARTLVNERLAACVHLHAPMTSFYRWKGQVERDTERQLVIKTTADRLDALRERLTALHPYELPEFVVVRADGGSEAYVTWVREQTRP